MVQSKDKEALDFFMELARNTKLLTPEEEFKLGQDLKAGGAIAKRAKDKLVTSHLRLSISTARKFLKTGLAFEDLIQEGNIGLMRAADKFDVDRGFRFVTYARWWVLQSVKLFAYERGADIRVPVNRVVLIHKMNRVIDDITASGEVPSDEEVAARLELEVKAVQKLAVHAQKPISLNITVGQEDEETELGDFIEDKTALAAEDALLGNDINEAVANALECLNERQRYVIIRRFGLDGDEPGTLEEIGQVLEVTRERVRQIEVKAKEILGKGDRGKALRALL